MSDTTTDPNPYATAHEREAYDRGREAPPDLGTFSLIIETGNAAMSTREDVSDVLRCVAESVERGVVSRYSDGEPIRDANGNRVGGWRFE